MEIATLLKNNRLIAAAPPENLENALNSNVSFIILMNGTLSFFIDHFKDNEKLSKPLFIHTDLMKGLNNDKEAFRFLASTIKPAGIVTTKNHMIRAAKKENFLTIMRVFLIDTNSLKLAIRNIKENKPDAVEVMPGIAPQIVKILKKEIEQPIILGGLIWNEKQIEKALKAGADGVSMSKEGMWNSLY
ncbi:glycerol-3-phosphate responsive antiterminator [Aquibacillus albus]|uniref:Glycerol uptake operon antiterminator regulatory protein n=1 Tax=Aquibacillus albus TaxID=1168171 RepID=A0ABS2N674_9BACI|nr:glycerol-3-phosphate responsive antiterminator [Aquibacillus albus]MBM7573654.1 glycerol uptake operon antiterminator [Aquibacillus albus]